MAGLIYDVDIPALSLPAGVSTVVGWITAPVNQRINIRGYKFSFDMTVFGLPPIVISLSRNNSSLGTLTTGGYANLLKPGLPEVPRSTFGLSASVQPTIPASLVYKTFTVQGYASDEYIAPYEEWIDVAGGWTWIAQAFSQDIVNVRGSFRVEE